MSPQIELDPVQIEKTRKLAEEQRICLGFVGDTIVANDIFTILDKLGIYLLEYPVESEGPRPAFSASLIYFNEGEKELAFLGLNTADYFDKQIFAIAHELYHYFTKTGSHLSRLLEEESTLVEAEANRFAAEFILPESVLVNIIISEFKAKSLYSIDQRVLTRFIARLHCTWWLPYRSIVRRLKEIDAITEDQFDILYKMNERDINGEFARICSAINKEDFLRLNSPTNNVGTSPKYIEIVIRNFEDSIIDDNKFISTLELFGKTPEDFGYDIRVSDEDIEEFEGFLKEGDDES